MSTITFEDLEGAKREITAILPEEVSLVDVPAIKERFAVIKSEDGGEADSTEVTEEATEEATPATEALLKDLEANFNSKITELEKAIETMRAAEPVAKAEEEVSEPEPEAEAAVEKAEAGENAEAQMKQLVSAVAKGVMAELETRGVIAKAEEPEDTLHKAVDDLRTGVKDSFEKVGEIVKSLADRLDTIETTDSGSNQDKAANEVVEEKIEKSQDDSIVSTMLMGGLVSSSPLAEV